MAPDTNSPPTTERSLDDLVNIAVAEVDLIEEIQNDLDSPAEYRDFYRALSRGLADLADQIDAALADPSKEIPR